MAETILKQIADGVNWIAIFYVMFALGVLYVAQRIGISPPHLLSSLTKHVTVLFTQPKISRSTIDAAITLTLILITILVGIYCLMREIPNSLSMFTRGVEGDGQPVFLLIFMVFMLVVEGILSLFAISPTKTNLSGDDDATRTSVIHLENFRSSGGQSGELRGNSAS